MLHDVAKIVVVFFIVHISWAQTVPDGEIIDQARQSLRSVDAALPKALSTEINQQLQAASKLSPKNSEVNKSRAALSQSSDHLQGVDIENIKIDGRNVGADIGQLLKKFQQLPSGDKRGERPPLFIFVSQSIPLATMKKLITQSEQTGVPLVFRGFVDGSLRNTLAYFKTLLGNSEPNVVLMIDPVLFKRFSIEQVPAFTVVRSSELCIGPSAHCGEHVPDHYSVFGDVSLGYAIETLQRLAPSFNQELAPVEKKVAVQF